MAPLAFSRSWHRKIIPPRKNCLRGMLRDSKEEEHFYIGNLHNICDGDIHLTWRTLNFFIRPLSSITSFTLLAAWMRWHAPLLRKLTRALIHKEKKNTAPGNSVKRSNNSPYNNKAYICWLFTKRKEKIWVTPPIAALLWQARKPC